MARVVTMYLVPSVLTFSVVRDEALGKEKASTHRVRVPETSGISESRMTKADHARMISAMWKAVGGDGVQDSSPN